MKKHLKKHKRKSNASRLSKWCGSKIHYHLYYREEIACKQKLRELLLTNIIVESKI